MVTGYFGLDGCAEQVQILDDPESGLKGVIVLHSTALGPAAGGCRLRTYVDEASARHDAFRLAKSMAYKTALAGLPFGGGQAVLMMPSKPFSRAELFRAFGRAVGRLKGAYITSEDLGTSIEDMVHAAERTRYVAGIRQRPAQSGGDTSRWTAKGVFIAMEVAAAHRLGKNLSQCVVAIQGCGKVGSALAVMLHKAGARLLIADVNPECTGQTARIAKSAEIIDRSAIFSTPVDIFSPCAMGGVLNDQTIPMLKARIICGAANNQLAQPEHGLRLRQRGIGYAPDYIVNAGGLISIAGEYLGWQQGEVARRVNQIGSLLGEVFGSAARSGKAPEYTAALLAQSVLNRMTQDHGTGNFHW